MMLMELWMEEEENMRKAEEFKIRRSVLFFVSFLHNWFSSHVFFFFLMSPMLLFIVSSIACSVRGMLYNLIGLTNTKALAIACTALLFDGKNAPDSLTESSSNIFEQHHHFTLRPDTSP